MKSRNKNKYKDKKIKEDIIISLGGSLIVPNKSSGTKKFESQRNRNRRETEVNVAFLKKFIKIIIENTLDYRFIIVCGGGKTARTYINAINAIDTTNSIKRINSNKRNYKETKNKLQANLKVNDIKSTKKSKTEKLNEKSLNKKLNTKTSKLSEKEKDILGILSSKLNAQLVLSYFTLLSNNSEIIDTNSADNTKAIKTMNTTNTDIRRNKKLKIKIIINPDNESISNIKKHDIIISAGNKPGCSTDYDTVRWALFLDKKVIINLTDVSYIYNKDPLNPRNKKLKPYKSIKMKDYLKMVDKKFNSGSHLPFDQKATKLAQRNKIKVIITKGDNLNNILKNMRALNRLSKSSNEYDNESESIEPKLKNKIYNNNNKTPDKISSPKLKTHLDKATLLLP